MGSQEAKNEYVEVQMVTIVRVSNGQLSDDQHQIAAAPATRPASPLMTVKPWPALRRTGSLAADLTLPVACAEPGAPEESVITPDPDARGGLVLLSLVSMYASAIGLFRQEMTGSIVKGG